MDSQPPTSHSPEPSSQPAPPRHRVSRRASLLGSLIAVAVVLGVGWLAWELTHREAPATSAAGAGGSGPGAARPGGGGPAGGGRGPATTVGVATAEHADIPIVIDALGTVVPQLDVDRDTAPRHGRWWPSSGRRCSRPAAGDRPERLPVRHGFNGVRFQLTHRF